MARWFASIPLPPREEVDPTFWTRDSALWCRGFQLLGIESKVVALGEPCQRQDRPLILAPLQQMGDPEWWQQWDLDGVVLFSWALRRYEPIARAIKQAGAKLVLYLDTGGFISPHVWPWMYWRLVALSERNEGRWFPRTRALVRTLGASLRLRHLPRLRHLALADFLALPSPLGYQRYKRYLLAMGRPDISARMRLIPYPIEEMMTYDPAVRKQPLLIAVGGWHRFVKDAPLLVRVLGRVLERYPAYSARIIGGGEERLRQLVRRLKPESASRIQILGPVLHDKLLHHYQESQISLCSSYSESFHLASAEALCCGCSVVGDVRLSPMSYFTSFASGTPACTRSLDNMGDAVAAEIDAWQSGERDPEQISRYWTLKLHPQHAARKLLSCFEGQMQHRDTPQVG